jgi:hypothetical protein
MGQHLRVLSFAAGREDGRCTFSDADKDTTGGQPTGARGRLRTA